MKGKLPPFITQVVETSIIDDPRKVGTRPMVEILVREGDRYAKAWLDSAQADELAASLAWLAEDARAVGKSERFLATSPATPSLG